MLFYNIESTIKIIFFIYIKLIRNKIEESLKFEKIRTIDKNSLSQKDQEAYA